MTPLEWVGAIVAVLVALGIAFFGLGYLVDILWRRFDQLLWSRAERRIRQRGDHMKHQHYWWPNPEHAAVWIACAEHMADGNYPEAEKIRDHTYPKALAKVLASRAPLTTASAIGTLSK